MNISNELEATIQVLVLQNRKVEAIKMVRDATDCSLKEAKEFVDTFPDDPEQMPLEMPKVSAKPVENIDEELLSLIDQGRKLEAIKLYKDTTGQSLAQCKAYIDDLESSGTKHITSGSGFKATDGPRQTSIDDVMQQQGGAKPRSGCFIATACYDHYDAPEVWLLRQYRDERLMPTTTGRVFVRFYYQVSPAIARSLRKMPAAKKIVTQYLLEPMIRILLK